MLPAECSTSLNAAAWNTGEHAAKLPGFTDGNDGKLTRETMTAEDRLAAAAATIWSMPAEKIDSQLARLAAAPPGTSVLTALQETVMAVCWAAGTPLTATTVFGRLDYPDAVTRCTVATACSACTAPAT